MNRTEKPEFFDVFAKILSAYPDGARTLTSSFDDDFFGGEFALDLACKAVHKHNSSMRSVSIARGSTEEKVIRLLMKEYAMVLRYQTGLEKGTWLLRMLEHRPNLGLVKDMVEKCDSLEGLSKSDTRTIRQRIVEVEDNEGNFPIHVAVEYYSEPEVIKYLIKSFPASVKNPRSCDGNLPLHLSARCNCFDESRALLLQIYPEAVSMENKALMTPLHLLFLMDEKDVPNGTYLWNRSYMETTVGGSKTEVMTTDADARSVYPRCGTISRNALLKSMIEDYCRFLTVEKKMKHIDAVKTIQKMLQKKQTCEEMVVESIYELAKKCDREIEKNGPTSAKPASREAFNYLDVIITQAEINGYNKVVQGRARTDSNHNF